MGSGFKPSFFATNFSILGPMCANVPTAPDMAHVEISSIACSNLFLDYHKNLHFYPRFSLHFFEQLYKHLHA